MNRNLLLLLACLLFTFSVAASETYPREENTLRIMSYNVHNCKGMDGKFDYDRIAGVIEQVLPDVIALQELDSVTQRNGGIYALGQLAERTHMYPIYGPAINYEGGKFGIGVLSKERPVGHRLLPLPGREEKRMLLVVEFENYLFCCTHFSLTEEDRKASVALILQALKDESKPVFLAGDMNDTPDSPVQKALKEMFLTLNDTKANTYPVVTPKSCIDYLYAYTGNGHTFSVTQRRVVDEHVASDHLPLFADVRIATDASRIMRTKPDLQNPTGLGMTVTWQTNVPVHSWVEYGTTFTIIVSLRV